ncbi:MAG: sulfatase [Pirellulales bacterium]|jgi:arylsulfatase A-like enzyme
MLLCAEELKRVAFVLVVLTASTLVPSASRGEAVAERSRPNIVVFLVDDMGPMDTSVPFMTDGHGTPVRYPLNDYYRTPSMQRLADQGVRFSTFYAMSVCSPTRTSILTGQNAARHRVTQWIRSEENNRGPFGPPDWNWTGVQDAAITLPGLLKTAGYRTVFVGKGHFGPIGEPSEWPDNLGFDVNIGGCSWGQPGSYYGEDGYGAIKGNKSRAVPHLEAYHGTDTFLSEALTIEAKKQISQAVEDGVPFFLDFAHYAVHGPFHSDPRYAAGYEDSGKSKPAQAYATLIEGMDASLGDLLDHLQALGVAEETLILFLGDNGSDAPLGPEHEHASSFPLRAKKGTHYEGGMRTPFIAAWAATSADAACQQQLPITPGGVHEGLGTVMDLYPTLLAVAGVQPPAGHEVDGVDLRPQLTGAAPGDRPQRFLMHFPHSHRSSYFTVFRDGDWKVIYHYLPEQNPAKVRYELFNLAEDPFEKQNLAEAQPLKLAEMMAGLVAELESHAALYPVDETGKALRPLVP